MSEESQIGENLTNLPVSVTSRTFISAASSVQTTLDWTWPAIIVLSLLSVIGNMVIFIVICASVKFRRPVNFLIASLALTSIVFVTSVVLRFLEDVHGVWNYSVTTCHLLGTLHRLPLTVEAFTVTVISIDRLRVVKEPLTPETTRGAFLKILLSWLLGFIIEIPRGLYHEYDASLLQNNYKCKKIFLFQNETYHLTYVTIHLIIVYVLPTVILFTELVKLRAHMAFLTLCHTQNDGNLKARVRLLKTASYLIWFFIAIHLPIGLTHAMHECPKGFLPPWLYRTLRMTRYHLYFVAAVHCYFYSILIFFSSYELRNYIKNCFRSHV